MLWVTNYGFCLNDRKKLNDYFVQILYFYVFTFLYFDYFSVSLIMQNTLKHIFFHRSVPFNFIPLSNNNFMGSMSSSAATPSDPKEKSIYDFTAKDIDGNEIGFDKYRGKVLLVVNVASKCGFTDSNYAQLKTLLDKYKSKGLEIAAFPCNQFNSQEPGCAIDIKEFVNKKYNFEPDLYDKVDVNGPSEHPIYTYLKSVQGGILGFDAIKWNFTKFLVNKKGTVVERYAPTKEPKNIESEIEKLLDE